MKQQLTKTAELDSNDIISILKSYAVVELGFSDSCKVEFDIPDPDDPIYLADISDLTIKISENQNIPIKT